MASLAGFAPYAILQTVLAGFLGLVAVSCGIALLLDAVRWMAGEKKGDADRESVGPMARALKDKVVVAIAIAAIAGSGATLATAAGQSAGSAPSGTIASQGPTGWMADGAAAGHTTTMGEALNQVAEATRGQTFEGRIQQDYEQRVESGTEALASAADKASSGDFLGSAGDALSATWGYTTAIMEDMWLGDNAAGIRNYLSGNLLGTNLNGWRTAANWITTYWDSYTSILGDYLGR